MATNARDQNVHIHHHESVESCKM